MKRYAFSRFIIISLFLIGCEDVHITPGDLIELIDINKKEVRADGLNTVEITVYLNRRAAEGKRTIELSSSNGKFSTSEKNTITITAKETLDNKIAGKAVLLIPNTAKDIIITASIENYVVSDTIKVVVSQPQKIEVSGSSFSVQANYGDDILITGKLLNQDGNNVSVGQEVIFSDYYKGTDVRVNGKFREIKNLSNNESLVTAIYTPGNIPADTTIEIRVNLKVNPTIQGATDIYVKPKE